MEYIRHNYSRFTNESAPLHYLKWCLMSEWFSGSRRFASSQSLSFSIQTRGRDKNFFFERGLPEYRSSEYDKKRLVAILIQTRKEKRTQSGITIILFSNSPRRDTIDRSIT